MTAQNSPGLNVRFTDSCIQLSVVLYLGTDCLPFTTLKQRIKIRFNLRHLIFCYCKSSEAHARWSHGPAFIFFYVPTPVARWRRRDRIRAKKLVFPSHLMYRQETWWSGNTISGNPLDELANNIPWIVEFKWEVENLATFFLLFLNQKYILTTKNAILRKKEIMSSITVLKQ